MASAFTHCLLSCNPLRLSGTPVTFTESTISAQNHNKRNIKEIVDDEHKVVLEII